MINLTVVIDNDEALKKLKELEKVATQTTSSVVSDAERMDMAFNEIGNSLSDLTAGFAMEEFIRKMVSVRGEVQQLEVAFETMLGSKQKSDALMKEMIDLAAKTPFGLQDVTNAAKQLLAFGSTSEEVASEITMLGDIAAGLSIPLGDMIYLYGTTRTQGRMFTQDLRQFMGRGIPLAEELAKQFGVTKAEVGDLVTAGKVGFDDMQKALQGMTSAGGQFGGLMEKQSQTITGQISALEDAIFQMFNEIGESNEGVINSVLQGASWMVEHYELVLGIISKLVIAYGAYRAALMAYAAIQGAINLIGFGKQLFNVVKGVQTLTMAWRTMNTTMKKNAIGLIASLLATTAAIIWDACDATEELAGDVEETERAIGKLEQAVQDEMTEVNTLVEKLKQANLQEDERIKALNRLKEINPDIVQGITDEASAMDTLTNNLLVYNEEMEKRLVLAALADKKTSAFDDYIQAKADLAVYEEEVRNKVRTWREEQKSREYWGQVRQPNNSFPSPSQVSHYYNDALAKYDRGEVDELGLLDLLYNDVQAAGMGDPGKLGREMIDIYGINEDFIGEKLNRLRKGVTDAEIKLNDADKAIQLLSEQYGITPEFLEALYGGEETPYEPSYKDDLEEARKAYLEAKAQKEHIEENPSEYTTEVRNAAVQAYEDAKKAYEALGGDTKSDEIKAKKEAERRARELADAQLQLDRDLEQERINQLAEGGERERAQIALNYQLREDEIARQEAELKGKQGGALTDEQTSQFTQLRAYSAAQRDKELNDVAIAERRAMNEYLAEYGEYQEKRLAIAELYAEKIANATNEWERKGIEKERDKELAALDSAMAAKSDLWIRLFGDADKMSRAQLKDVIKETKQLLDYLRGVDVEKPIGFTEEQLESIKNDAEQISLIYEELYEKQEELNTRTEYPLSNIIQASKLLSEASDIEKKAAEEQDEAQKKILLDSAKDVRMQAKEMAILAASNAAETIDSIADSLMRLSEATDNENIEEMAQSLSAVGQTFSAIAEGAAAGGWVGAIVGGVTGIISGIVEAFTTREAEIHEFEQNRKDFLTEYQKLLVSIKNDDYETPFGSSELKRASDIGKMLKELKQMYDDATLAELGALEGPMSYLVKDGKVMYGNSTIKNELESYLDAVRKEYNALEGMLIKTLDRSGFANMFGFGDEFTALKDLAPELWGENGLFNVEAARIFLDTNTQITDEQRKQIENIIDLQDRYDEAMSEIDGMISNVFGNLSEDLTDIIFDSVRNGTDAWDEFGKKGSEIIDALGRQMVQELMVQAYLEQYREDLTNAFISGDSNKIAEVTNQIFDNMGLMLEGASAAAAAWDANAEAMGFNTDNISQEATTRGFQAMSQDTGDELNGRFTDIQGKTSAINDAVQYIKSLTISQLQHTTSISETLAQIHNDTSLIEKHTRELSLIRSGIDRMNKNLENI